MSSSRKQKSWGFYIFRRERIKNSDYKKLLGIEVDTNLNFILTHNLVLALLSGSSTAAFWTVRLIDCMRGACV